MNKKSLFIVVSVLLLLFITFGVVRAYIINTIDEANKRGIELYASSIRYAYTSRIYKTGVFDQTIDDLEISTTLNVYCTDKSIDRTGKVELHGCTVDGSKKKYGYVNEKVIKE